MEQAFRYRFYPTPEQENLLRQTMGCARLVYNRALAARTEAWYERQQRVEYAETSSMLTQWKKQEDLQFRMGGQLCTVATGIETPPESIYKLLWWLGEISQFQEAT